MLKGFKDFILRGNIVELAVALVIGLAFTALITAFTDAFIKPLIGLILGGGVDAGTLTIRDQVFDFTLFINAVITFLATAAAVYFAIVVPMNKLRERRLRGQEPEPETPPSEDILLLQEIRDLLRQRSI
ncbi:MAG: large conductance mechanosensitive channel protein MscL [Actinomycetes bacterium]